MTDSNPTWWVSYRGDVILSTAKPDATGWSSCVSPRDTPVEFDPDKDVWLHLVVSPGGAPVYVHLQVNDEGGWSPVAVLSETEAHERSKDASEVYTVGNTDGKIKAVERLT